MFGKRLSAVSARLKHSIVALLFVGTQLLFPLGISGAFVGHASAAQSCVTDTGLANDVPGQKDLTKLCVDYSGVPISVATTWNWDDAGTQGANSMDACNLFDTNGDGNVNYAVCVSTTGNPASFGTLTTYSCSDKSIDTCTSPSAVVSSGTTSCTVQQSATDPFPTGDDYPNDTQGSCTIQLSTVGGSSATLIDVCSYPSGQPNSDPADCVIAKQNAAKLEVVKSLSPSNDSGLFDLGIDTTTYATGVGDGGNTGEQVKSADNNGTSYTVFEKANSGSPTTLSDYNTSAVCKDGHGTGTTLSSSASLTDSTTRQLSVTIKDGTDVVCTFTNTRQSAQLTLEKDVTNDNGGTSGASSWTLKAQHGSDTPVINQTGTPTTIQDTSAKTSTATVDTNTSYTLSESATPAGYAPGSWSCPGGTVTTTNGVSSVTLSSGSNVTCSITNNDIAPTLTLVKQATNDNGGTQEADQWTLTAQHDADTPIINEKGTLDGGSTTASSSATTTTATASANTAYTLSESTTPAGYASGSWSCPGGTVATTNGVTTVTLALNTNVTCTITNNDTAPTLTLVKHVSGGTATATDWTLSATPTNNSHSTLSGSGGFSNQTAWANDPYALSESTGPTGYTPGSWGCSGGGTLNGSSLTLAPGESVTCTITNTRDTGTVTVNKTLLPSTDSGTFNLSITGTDNFSYTANTQGDGGTTGKKTVDTGTYTVSETGYSTTDLNNYLSTYECKNGATTVASGSGTSVSNLSVDKGHDIVCTFTNTHKASISGTKYEVNADGSNVGPIQGWTIYLLVSGSQNPLSAQTAADGSFSFSGLDPSQSYTLSEDTSNTSYTQLTFPRSTCSSTTYSFGLTAGENSTQNNFCNFQNASISGMKFEDVNNSGSLDAGDLAIGNWTINLYQGTDTSVTPFQTTTTNAITGLYSFGNLAPGEYTVCEKTDSQPGYTQTDPVTNNGCYDVNVVLSGHDYSGKDFGNFKNASISGFKFDDLNGNASWDKSSEDGLSNWTIDLYDSSHTVKLGSTSTASDGSYSFTDVAPSKDGYLVCEVQQNGWTQTYPTTNTGCNEVVVILSGHDYSDTNFGNYPDPSMSISKSNNQTTPGQVGDTVQYTVVVTVPDNSGDINNATVTDLPPDNFTVDPSSEQATLTSSDGTTTTLNVNPNYGSPGLWNVGLLHPGDILTLIYKAKIGSVANGKYPDLAFVKGQNAHNSTTVLGSSQLNAVAPAFVGTTVAVVSKVTPTTFAAGQVLGAEVLVNTGTSLLSAQYILPVILIFGLYITRRMTEEKGGK